MKVAIIGPKGSGKSELYKALLGEGSQIQNRAVVKVKDSRLSLVKEVFNSKKVTYPEIEYLDVPGGGEEGLGSKMINAVRPYDCLLVVLDGFSGKDPKKQWSNVEADLILSDLSVVEKRLERIRLDRKKSKSLVDEEEEKLLIEARKVLEKELPLRSDYDLFSTTKLKGFEFLSLKPVIYIWNLDEIRIKEFEVPPSKEKEAHLKVCVKLEKELLELEDEELKEEFLKEMGMRQPFLSSIILTTYKLMNLITFFTADEKEARGWTIRKGSSALKAAGCVHSDMEKGFIRAEVISWEDFERLKDMKKAKEEGCLRLEGKEYVVQDGDLIRFRFKV